AYFVFGKEAKLEKIFLRRGQALKFKIYGEPSRRRRLYRTGFPPRIGSQMLELYPAIKEHLLLGDQYGLWENDNSLRFEYIRTIVEQLGSLSKFKLENIKDNTWEE